MLQLQRVLNKTLHSIMRHPRYCLAHHPSISSNIINVTHFSTQPTLAHHPPQPHWHTTHWHTTHAIHADTSPTLACHRRKRNTHTNTPHTPPTLLTLACHPRQHTTHVIHASTNSTPFLKLLRKYLSNLLYVLHPTFVISMM